MSKMRVLAVETSTMLGGIAVMEEEAGLLAELRQNVKGVLSERLMGWIHHLLGQCGLDMGNIDALVVSTGPGSFTGLRVGLGTVKGLAFASGLPVVGVPTLEAFAWALNSYDTPICPMLDARKNEVYAGLFIKEGEGMQRLIGETSAKPADFLKELQKFERVIFAGEGASLYKKEIELEMEERAHFAPSHLMSPSPAALAHIGLRLALREEFVDPRVLRPYYIRKSEAELKKKR
jgi:tRNA threonylcarbamoyladenosine biosynthesis protein TsaB